MIGGINMAPLFTNFHFGFARNFPEPEPPPVPFAASGGNANGTEPGNGYTYHTFTTPGTFTISQVGPATMTIEMILVGGGGAGGVANNEGSDGGGAGGAGELTYIPQCPVSGMGGAATYSISIGNGGTGVTGGQTPGYACESGQQGEGTSFSTPNGSINAKGGGGGGNGPIGGPLGQYGDGGSGGGGGGGGGATPTKFGEAGADSTHPLIPGVTATEYSEDGGFGTNQGSNYGYEGGGGGGAGGAGQPAHASPGANLGGVGNQYPGFTGNLIGIPALNPLSGYFAGGGSGGAAGPGTRPAHGGPPGGGGGGSPGSDGPLTGQAAHANSGSGGGGAAGNQSPPGPDGPGGNGATGIVMIRYIDPG